MSSPLPPSSAPVPGDDRNLVSVDELYPALSFEERLRLFWEKNGKTVLIACAIVLLGIVAKGGYELYASQREKTIAADYASATSDDQLKAFAAAHPSHTLGGLARLRLADTAYTAGRYTEARAAYDQAVSALTGTLFAPRARLGAALSQVLAGQTSEGETALRSLVNDLSVAKAARAEAAYHLATLAAAAGRADDATKLVEQISAIDATSQWSQRAQSLRARLPVTFTAPAASATETPATPSVSFKAAP